MPEVRDNRCLRACTDNVCFLVARCQALQRFARQPLRSEARERKRMRGVAAARCFAVQTVGSGSHAGNAVHTVWGSAGSGAPVAWQKVASWGISVLTGPAGVPTTQDWLGT